MPMPEIRNTRGTDAPAWVTMIGTLKNIAASGATIHWEKLANELEIVAGELRTNLDRVISVARLDLTAALGARDWDQASVVEISGRVETWRNELITINDWIAARGRWRVPVK